MRENYFRFVAENFKIPQGFAEEKFRKFLRKKFPASFCGRKFPQVFAEETFLLDVNLFIDVGNRVLFYSVLVISSIVFSQ